MPFLCPPGWAAWTTTDPPVEIEVVDVKGNVRKGIQCGDCLRLMHFGPYQQGQPVNLCDLCLKERKRGLRNKVEDDLLACGLLSEGETLEGAIERSEHLVF